MSEAIFTPYADSDPHVNSVKGHVEVLRELSSDEADANEVGRMFRVRNRNNNFETDAFADELTVGVSR